MGRVAPCPAAGARRIFHRSVARANSRHELGAGRAASRARARSRRPELRGPTERRDLKQRTREGAGAVVREQQRLQPALQLSSGACLDVASISALSALSIDCCSRRRSTLRDGFVRSTELHDVGHQPGGAHRVSLQPRATVVVDRPHNGARPPPRFSAPRACGPGSTATAATSHPGSAQGRRGASRDPAGRPGPRWRRRARCPFGPGD